MFPWLMAAGAPSHGFHPGAWLFGAGALAFGLAFGVGVRQAAGMAWRLHGSAAEARDARPAETAPRGTRGGRAPRVTRLARAAKATGPAPTPAVRELRNGRLTIDGKWVFLKTGKPLRNFANAAEVDRLIRDLPLLQAKHFNCLELNCYWHHFDTDGDGVPDVSLEPLRRLIDAINAQGMFACLSVETYGVGGGQIPPGFWARHPDAVAVNSEGMPVRDTEYGFGTAVPSIFCPAYRDATHTFIRSLAHAVDTRKLLYFETTVEPQFIGNAALDFSAHARAAYAAWRKEAKMPGPPWPNAFPTPASFRGNSIWQRFRAESLAAWVNGDAAAYREAAGKDALVAVDYLETCGPEMANRNGDSVTFLEHLTAANILQVNWHWHLGRRQPNSGAYENVRRAMRESGRSWAISEHMTLNGSDFRPEDVPAILRNTLAQGTRFGWEFVNVAPSTRDPFSLYNDDWTPKPLMAVVDDNWDRWMEEVKRDG